MQYCVVRANANGTLSGTLLNLAFSSQERKRLADGAKRTVTLFQQSAMIGRTEALLQASAQS